MYSMVIHSSTFRKKIHAKFPKCYLFMDKASPHYKSKKVRTYFEENKDTMIPIYLPTASPEFMVMEEVWNIAKQDLLILKYYTHHLQILKTRYLDISEQKGLISI